MQFSIQHTQLHIHYTLQYIVHAVCPVVSERTKRTERTESQSQAPSINDNAMIMIGSVMEYCHDV